MTQVVTDVVVSSKDSALKARGFEPVTLVHNFVCDLRELGLCKPERLYLQTG